MIFSKRNSNIKIFVFSLFILVNLGVHAQGKTMEEAVEKMTSYHLEKLENTNGIFMDEDMMIQHWSTLYKNPLDLNKVDESELQKQLFVNPLQTQAFMTYRKGIGHLEDIHELQSLPGWDPDWIRLLSPFVKISETKRVFDFVNDIAEEGNHKIQFRAKKIMQKKMGFQSDSLGRSPFAGSRWSREVRYAYAYGKKIKFGFQGESDAGEKWAMKGDQIGMDNFRYYLSVENQNKWIRKLVLGDYTVNIGQGLMLWQSFGGYKGNDVLMIKNQQKGIEPYRSTGEGFGFRGLGIEANRGKQSILFFVSSKKTDAAFVTDSVGNILGYRPCLTGLHRTTGEIETRNKLRNQTLGYTLSHSEKKFNISFNHVFSLTQHGLISGKKWYDRFEKKGRWQNNLGIDFSAQYFGSHFFGEWIMDHNREHGLWIGVLSSLTKSISVSSFYRKLDRGLMSFSVNLPNEYGSNNEDGFYMGIKLSTKRLVVDAYSDAFRSKWLRFGINSPSFGNEWVICANFKSEDKTDLQIRLKQENRPVNEPFGQDVGIKPWHMARKSSVRIGIQREINDKSVIKIRTEVVQHNVVGNRKTGQFYLFEIRKLYMQNKLKLNAWFCYSDIPDPDLAMYLFETDPVVGAVQLTSLYRTGLRVGVALAFQLHKKLKINLKYTESIHTNEKFQGEGLDQTIGSGRSELGLGLVFKR